MSWIRRKLDTASTAAFSTYAIAAAFSAYFCMYAFRKPFAAATFEGELGDAIDLKIALVIAQVVGYALSKFLSIKFVSEISPTRRAATLLGLIAAAELALGVFAVVPPGGKVIAIFFNGLPLGAVWGLVYGFLEGRRTSELLGAGLSTSYIVASGAVKSVGAAWLEAGVSESWMPFITGLCFAPAFLLAVYLLRQLPPPTPEDEAARTVRAPMRGPERVAFIKRFAFGLVTLTGLYMFLTAYRDFRDNFAAEIWGALGWGDEPAIFTASELPVALMVMAALASIYTIKGNRTALLAIHALMAVGTILIGGATLLFDAGLISGAVWMVALGVGLYLAYVPYGCVLFDRLIAATGAVGTAVFMIYVTDAFGYAGSVGLLLFKNFGGADLSWLDFFRGFSYASAVACTAAFVASGLYFSRLTREDRS
ncbi:MAG: DUF5690 family protein [Myxococcota bacterium]